MLRTLLTHTLRARFGIPRRHRAAKRVFSQAVEQLESRQLLAIWSGNITNGTVWTNTEVQHVTGNVHVPAGATLTIQPGTVIKFDSTATNGITVDGTLKAQGTAQTPIYFTSIKDDTVGGDTNGDGTASAPAAGQWDALKFNSASTANVLSHVAIRYAGATNPCVVFFGGQLTMSDSTVSDGAASGLRVQSGRPTVTNTLFQRNYGRAISLSLTGDVGGSGIAASENLYDSIVVDSGTFAANQTWSGTGLPYLIAAPFVGNGGITIPAGITLSISAGVVFQLDDFFVPVSGAGTIRNAGTIRWSSGSGDVSLIRPAVVNTGTIDVAASGLQIDGQATFNGNSVLTGAAGSNFVFLGGIAGSTQNAAGFAPLGTVQVSNVLEAMSAEKGANAAGFTQNFAYHALELVGDVKLANNADNVAGSGAEAVYADSVHVFGFATLNLNGLHLYTRHVFIESDATVTGGTITVLPDGGPLTLNAPTAGYLSQVGEVDDWTITGKKGASLTITVSPGSGGANPPDTPTANYTQVQFVGPSGQSLGVASNTAAGAEVALAGITLPADGTYHIKVKAPGAQPGSTGNYTGNYVVTAWGATVHVAPVVLNQAVSGNIDTPSRADRWTFSGTAGQVLNLNRVSAGNADVQFDLTGPGGFVAFRNSNSSTTNITLPTGGSYAVTVHTARRQTGTYSFRLDAVAVAPIKLATPVAVNVAGAGQSQLFKVNVPTTQQQLQVALTDTVSTDRNEVYVKFGSAPSRTNFDYKFTSAAANQTINVPSPAKGDWYVFVYSAAAATGKLTLKVTGINVVLAGVSPNHVGNAAAFVLTLTGSGFDSSSVVSLISPSNARFTASTTTFNLATKLTARFNAGAVPAGTYTVEVAETSGTTTLPRSLAVSQGGQAHFSDAVVDMVGPSGFGSSRYTTGTTVFPYRINFKNDQDAAGPAQNVTVTDQLNSNLDWSTFQLGKISWGATILTPPAGSQQYQTTVSMTYNSKTFNVLVAAGLNLQTGLVTATFRSIDPATQLPPDVLTGFLPPEDGTGRGKGYVSYTVSRKSNLATGTQIRNVAVITFDTNATVATDQKAPHDPSQGSDPAKQALVTIDVNAPTSSVAALPATNPGPNIPVKWSGADAGGSGIATYDVFVSDNGAAFQAFQTGVKFTSATYVGVLGHTYRFYSVATDNLGHRQPTPAAAQATTKVGAADAIPPTGTLTAPDVSAPGGATYTFTVRYSDNVGINVATLGNDDVFVIAPNDQVLNQAARLVSVDTNSNGTPRTATYSINVPGGFWRTVDSGQYKILSAAGHVQDVNGNSVPANVLGTFDVSATTEIALLGSAYTDNLVGSTQVGFQLPRAPTSNVVITLSLTGANVPQASLSRTQLTFTPSNWDIQQSVKLTGADDTSRFGYIPYKVHAAVSSADPAYAHSVIPDKPLTNINGLMRVYNLYNQDQFVHFYTTNKGERDALVSLVNNVPFSHHPWIDSAPSYTSVALFRKSPGGSNVAYVQRLYNSQTSEHYYTTSIGEATALANSIREDPPGSGRFVPGWIWENRSQSQQLTATNSFQGYMYLPNRPSDTSADSPVGPGGTSPLYRFYQELANFDTGTGDHALTNDPDLSSLLGSSSEWIEQAMVGFGVKIASLEDAGIQSIAASAVSSFHTASPETTSFQTTRLETTSAELLSALVPVVAGPASVSGNPPSLSTMALNLPIASEQPVTRLALAAADSIDRLQFSASPRTPVSTNTATRELDAFWSSLGGDLIHLLNEDF